MRSSSGGQESDLPLRAQGRRKHPANRHGDAPEFNIVLTDLARQFAHLFREHFMGHEPLTNPHTAPCSVNTKGRYFTFRPCFKITFCDLERIPSTL
jgi:hypothetical protein